VYGWQGWSFPRLYLAGGVTTARTGGNVQGYADLNLKRDIDAGRVPGPDLDVTAPYLNGAGLPIAQVKALRGPEDARAMVEQWAGEGATSFKAYMQISRAELAAAIGAAHHRGLKVTGHLCSVTYREAADLGIDNLEHGFVASTDFVSGKEPDRCPPNPNQSLLSVDLGGPVFQDLVRHLVARKVALTSTLTVFETYTPGRPRAPDRVLDAMLPEVRDQYLRTFAQVAVNRQSPYANLFTKAMAMEREFAKAGGLLVVGTDPTGYGGVVAGFANQRAVELLVEAGFTPVEAIRIATLNGAVYLGRQERIGTIAVGKQADLIVVNGDPSTRIEDIRRMEIVFKRGIGYDSEKLFAAVKGTVGLR
jgi:enamidase